MSDDTVLDLERPWGLPELQAVIDFLGTPEAEDDPDRGDEEAPYDDDGADDEEDEDEDEDED